LTAKGDITPLEYHLVIRRIQEIAREAVRPQAKVLAISRGNGGLLELGDRTAWHFPRAEDGSYMGYHPKGSEDAIGNLEALREEGARYLILPTFDSWWFDHYPGLFEHLAQIARVVWADDACIIYCWESQAGGVNVFSGIDDTQFYVQGWLRDSRGPITRLTAIAPAGERIELLPRLFRYHHPDLARLTVLPTGTYERDWSDFVVRFETEAASQVSDGWSFELETEAGGISGLPAPPLTRELTAARSAILERLPAGAAANDQLMGDHVFPAVSRLQERARTLVKVERRASFGPPRESPEISIVIPVYARIDLIEHQLAQFAYDSEMQAAELIYVLDGRELHEWLDEAAGDLFELYGVPFAVIALEHTSGFAAATNAGASAAGGRLLLLMNSDVFPERPGWLGTLKAFYDTTDRIGALGAKLVYEDGSLQHAGMYFERLQEQPFLGLWTNQHYFKGFSRKLPAANSARPVAAVTAACLMIEKSLFWECGGLTDVYVQGDFEDSDLCLRLLERGRETWYLPDAELYHLESQSYDESRRAKQAYYNRWLHTRRWGEQIAAVAARFPPPEAPGA
jgi:GT2 family glycosyltransferase